MNTAGLYIITRKRHWELAKESADESNAATQGRDALYGAMFLLIMAILFAVWVTS